jgi:osmotically-inducible protein OsmY
MTMRRTALVLSFMVMVLGIGTAFAKPHASNAEITATIQDKLFHAKTFEHGQVQVDFTNGVATLSGTVDSLGAKLDAERAARKAGGVTEVVDRISVHAEDVTPRQIAEQARKQIVTYYAYGIFDNISLQAQGDRLIVSGQVSQPFKKADIGNFLAHVKGVAELENNLEVLPTSIYDDQLRRSIARAIYGDPYFVHYATQATPPIHIIVKNGSVRLEGVVATALDRAKAENDARFAATYFALTDNLRTERG